jgi:predicted amidophosphoribosyltransferase
MTTRCANCDAEIPDGGQFCIECGAPAGPAATGATERLPDHQGGPRCTFCGTHNPPIASFCVRCGQALTAPTAEPSRSAAPPTLEPAPIAYAPAAPARSQSTAQRTHDSARWGGIAGGLFLLGLALIAWLNWWWPGILVLVGVTALTSGLVAGRDSAQRWGGLQGGLFLLGLALIAWLNWWWPGILVLVGLTAILTAILRPQH